MPFDQRNYKQDVYPKVREYADRLEALPDENWVDMSMWMVRMYSPECKTVGCIAGYVCMWEGAQPRALYGDLDLPHAILAREYMGLDHDTAFKLFYPKPKLRVGKDIKARVARVMRHLAATGEVDWSLAKQGV